MRNRRGFTLIELLVVVAIIVALLAILLPSMNRAISLAVRTQCTSQTKQIVTATLTYASDSFGLLPGRPGWGAGNYRPHTMVAGSVDLVATFINPYLGGSRDTVMFCPSSLLDARNPTTTIPDYTYDNVTYQFHAYDTDNAWVVDMPDLTKVSGFGAATGLWSCLSITGTTGFYFGHDRPIVYVEPEGLNSALTDGSARWFDWVDTEFYIGWGDQQYMWPKPGG